jgi:hypothetical protein
MWTVKLHASVDSFIDKLSSQKQQVHGRRGHQARYLRGGGLSPAVRISFESFFWEARFKRTWYYNVAAAE